METGDRERCLSHGTQTAPKDTHLQDRPEADGPVSGKAVGTGAGVSPAPFRGLTLCLSVQQKGTMGNAITPINPPVS